MPKGRQYLWNIIGTLASTLVSIVLLMIASRFLNGSQADLFSIAYTIAQQLLIIGIFGVRPFQSTDVLEHYVFSDYVWTRFVTTVLMVACLLMYLLGAQYDHTKGMLIALVTLFRAIDSLSDVFQGRFQQQNRSDLAGKVLFYRSLVTITSFTLIILFTENLFIACLGMSLANVLLLGLDLTYLKNLGDGPFLKQFSLKSMSGILRQCLPLFVNAFLINYIFSEPRLVIDQLLSQGKLGEGLQRDFSILFMPTFALNLLFLMLRPLLTQLSTYWQSGQKAQFRNILQRVVFCLLFLQGLVLALGYSFGLPVLGAVFGVDLSAYQWPLFILLVGGGLNLFSALLDNLMVIYRGQKYLVIANLVTFVFAKLLTSSMISQHGMMGAAWSFTMSMFVYFVSSLMIYWFVNFKRRNNESFTHHSSL